MVLGSVGSRGQLETQVTRHGRDDQRVFSLHLPRLGRILFTRDAGSALSVGRDILVSSLHAHQFDGDGRLKAIHQLGSGLVTNAGVDYMANDFSWASGAQALKVMNQHGCGTGATAAAAADVVLQTAVGSGSLTGSTNGYMAGTQTLVAPNIYQTVATFSYTASLAITEWALFGANGAAVNIPTTGTTYSATGAAFTALGSPPPVGNTIVNLATAANTPTTTAMGVITASSTTTVTIPGWFTLANAAASTPTNATASQVVPTAWDHKVFGSISVASGDSVQFTYKLTVSSGG